MKKRKCEECGRELESWENGSLCSECQEELEDEEMDDFASAVLNISDIPPNASDL